MVLGCEAEFLAVEQVRVFGVGRHRAYAGQVDYA